MYPYRKAKDYHSQALFFCKLLVDIRVNRNYNARMKDKEFQKILNGVSQAQLARELGVSRMAVTKWKQEGIPAERVLEVESVTGTSRHTINSAIYPLDGKYSQAVV
jgi:DNA-binding transcriptional regulator YdaS (Cro superfamily)